MKDTKTYRIHFSIIPLSALCICLMLSFLWCANVPRGTTLIPVTQPKSSAKAITMFMIVDHVACGVIDEDAKTIHVVVPYSADITSMAALFITTGARVSVDEATQYNSITRNNFTHPLLYTVWAENGSTAVYTVTVTRASASAKQLTSFSFSDPDAAGVINETAKTIEVALPCTGNVSTLKAYFSTTGARVTVGGTDQTSGISVNDFISPVTYRVHAADSTWTDYTVTVNMETSSVKDFTSFSILGIPGLIDNDLGTITVDVPPGTDVTDLTPMFTTTGKLVTVGGVNQESGATENDFRAPITYRVTACDDSTRDFTVTVTGAGSGNAYLTSLSVDPSFVFTPEFSNTVFAYTAASLCGITGTSVRPVAEDTNAAITVNGADVDSGAWSGQISLPDGATTEIGVVVRAQNGVTNTYSLTLTVAEIACDNACRDGDETDVNCGGSCPKCGNGMSCGAAEDCASGVCAGGICAPPECDDDIQNGAESDVDCGGGTCPDCAATLHCGTASDCISNVCTGGICQFPTCTDTKANSEGAHTETGPDCGGSCVAEGKACPIGTACLVGSDCIHGVCLPNGTCGPFECDDGVTNGNETDIDCGGGTCPDCAATLHCVTASDCISNVCSGGFCQFPTCSDSTHNNEGSHTESDVDCGGSCVGEGKPCSDGKICSSGTDCLSGHCNEGICESYVIATSGPGRSWSDGTYAVSCEAYRRPVVPYYRYEGSTGDGRYYIKPEASDPAILVYCDMTYDGGGWTLVMSHAEGIAPPAPTWDEAVNGGFSPDGYFDGLGNFSYLCGVKYWNSIGTTLRAEVGTGPLDITHRATFTFSLDPDSYYAINMSNPVIVAGGSLPGLYATHNGVPLSAHNADHDAFTGGNCSYSYGYTAWWYNNCWSGSFWGGGGGVTPYLNKPYWTGTTEANAYDYGALWIR
ncbi:MAG: cadherin-like beta sandwich domain-containing protein [Spirochaetes bacterium]|nr:cadherin-like beta sandwich domain-containing protein [Spirochaetota bacterium]